MVQPVHIFGNFTTSNMHGTNIKLCSFCVCRVVHMDVYDGILAQYLNASFLTDFVKGSADVEPRMRVGRKMYVTSTFTCSVRGILRKLYPACLHICLVQLCILNVLNDLPHQ
jgi:hypothetical protein